MEAPDYVCIHDLLLEQLQLLLSQVQALLLLGLYLLPDLPREARLELAAVLDTLNVAQVRVQSLVATELKHLRQLALCLFLVLL